MVNNPLNKNLHKYIPIFNKLYEKRTNISDEVRDPESGAVQYFVPWSRAIKELFRILLHLEFRHAASTLLVIRQKDTVITMCCRVSCLRARLSKSYGHSATRKITDRAS